MTQENDSEVMMAQENVQKVIKIKVFYMRHWDSMSMSRIYPVFLLDGEQIWDAAIKSRISRNKMYYLFTGSSSYIKIWRDAKGNLLYTISNYHDVLFYDQEPEFFRIETLRPSLKWDDKTIYYTPRDGSAVIKIEFSVPIVKIVKELNQWAEYPLVYLLYRLYRLDDAERQDAQDSLFIPP